MLPGFKAVAVESAQNFIIHPDPDLCTVKEQSTNTPVTYYRSESQLAATASFAALK